MAETTSSSDTKYPFFLFNGSNYAEWKFQTGVYAQKIKALDILEGIKKRHASDATAQAEFDKLNEQLFHHIFATMKSAQQQLLRTVPLGDGHAAYKHLQTIYEPQTRAAVKQLLTPLLTLKQNGREMAVFVTDIVEVERGAQGNKDQHRRVAKYTRAARRDRSRACTAARAAVTG
jgi:hypothetical protein